MPYVTSIEEYGIEKGQVMACRQNILDLLEERFGTVPEAVQQRVNAETDLAKLRRWLRLVVRCSKPEDLSTDS